MDPTNILILGSAWYAVFIISITLHEASHGLVALKLGDPTAYHNGQVDINPAPHVRHEPFGMIVVPILSFIATGYGWMLGWASVPCDPMWIYRYPRRAAVMALAGPAANLILILIAVLAIRVGVALDAFYPPDSITFTQVTAAHAAGPAQGAALLVSILFSLNLILFTFNLVPLPPLDGSAMLPALMSRPAAERYMAAIHQPTFAIVGLLVAWYVFGRIFSPIHLFAINVLYPGVTYG